MPLRWTNSKDGRLRASVHVELRMAKSVYDWLQARTGWSQRATVAWWKEAVLYRGLNGYAGRIIAQRKNGDIIVATYDDLPNDRPDRNDPDLGDYDVVDWYDD
jgi:hypothetical protein